MLVTKLIAWVIQDNGPPGAVPTRYAQEIELPEPLEAVSVRAALRQAFVDGMAFGNAIAEAANPEGNCKAQR